MLNVEILETVKKQTTEKNLRLDLVLAIIEIESAGVPHAIRYEKNYIYYHRPEVYAKQHRISADTEKALQRFSYGLMQIMGGTARYIGFQGRLMDLLNPSEGLEWGCKYLRNICREYQKLSDQIAVYNAGQVKINSEGMYKNQEYVDKVMNLLKVRLVQ